MERIRIKVSKTPTNGIKCAMMGCTGFAVHRIHEFRGGEWTTAYQDFCEVHFMQFMNNGLLDIVQDV